MRFAHHCIYLHIMQHSNLSRSGAIFPLKGYFSNLGFVIYCFLSTEQFYVHTPESKLIGSTGWGCFSEFCPHWHTSDLVTETSMLHMEDDYCRVHGCPLNTAK